jgi:hypothetical protein
LKKYVKTNVKKGVRQTGFEPWMPLMQRVCAATEADKCFCQIESLCGIWLSVKYAWRILCNMRHAYLTLSQIPLRPAELLFFPSFPPRAPNPRFQRDAAAAILQALIVAAERCHCPSPSPPRRSKRRRGGASAAGPSSSPTPAEEEQAPPALRHRLRPPRRSKRRRPFVIAYARRGGESAAGRLSSPEPAEEEPPSS